MPVYKVLQTIEELDEVVQLEIAVWGVHPRDAVPTNIMRPLTLHGGVAIGAYEQSKLVGLALAFPARAENRWVLWSHMTGIHPELQGQGIGYGLKQAQRDWAIANGYREMRWTYDPLLRGNANFNLHRLGATTSIYHVNYYGVMQDAINPATPSDRVEVTWKLTGRRPTVTKRAIVETLNNPDLHILKSVDNEAPIEIGSVPSGARYLYVEIPRTLHRLSAECVNAWRLALRNAFQMTFSQGYTAVDFIDDGEKSGYLLDAGQPWYLYVLECNDTSLYTGITPKLTARLKQHNAGRAAAYTRTRLPVRLKAAWQFRNHRQAAQAEIAFKQLSRAHKLAHIEAATPYRNASMVDISSLS